jgi:hypothetical protein
MNRETPDGPASCRSVRNAFRLLELLAGSPDGLRLARLVDAAGMPKSSAHRILGTLEELGIVCRDEATANYHLAASWRRIVSPPRLSEFSAPVLSHDGRPVAGLTLRLRGQVSPGVPAAGTRWRRVGRRAAPREAIPPSGLLTAGGNARTLRRVIVYSPRRVG